MADKSFVDKVYDAYIKEDYSYGVDNLNPKREIRKMSLKDTDDQLNKILSSIQRKVTEISIKYVATDSLIDDDTIGNFGGAGRSNSLPASVREAINRSGGSGDMLVMIPSMDGDTTPLMQEIEISIAKILATINGGGLNRSDDNDNITDGINTNGLDLFDINCDGTLNLITGGENSNTNDDDSGDSDSDTGDDNNGNSNDDDNENGDNKGGSESGSSSNDDTTDSNDETSDAAMENAVNDAISKMESNIQNNEASARECAIKDLGLMKAFLAILKVIQSIKNAMNPLMNILYDTIRIVVLAAGCWNNPTNISEIIQRIAVKLVAIMIMIVAMLVQMFWEMLGLDCLTEEAKSVIDQIKKALTGVTSTYNNCERLAMSFGANVEKVKDAFDEAKDAVNQALSTLSTDKLKDMFDMSNIAEDIYNKGLGGAAGLKQSAINGLQSTGAYDDVLSTIEDIKSLKATADKTINTLTKSKGGKAANQTVRKIATQLHNVQSR